MFMFSAMGRESSGAMLYSGGLEYAEEMDQASTLISLFTLLGEVSFVLHWGMGKGILGSNYFF